MKSKVLLFTFFIALSFRLYANEVHSSEMSGGGTYYYTVSGSDSSGSSSSSGGSESSGSGASGGESSGGESSGGSSEGASEGSASSESSGSEGGSSEGGTPEGASEAAQALAAAEAAAREAEAALTEATKDFLAQQQVLAEMEANAERGKLRVNADGKAIWIDLTPENQAVFNAYYEGEKAKLDAAYHEVCKKSTAASVAYNVLGNKYFAMESSGDPVKVSTGEYILSYEDFLAQDYLDVFSVTRNLYSVPYLESFGRGWSCSLDSRIIRCNTQSYSEEIETVKGFISKLDEMITICNSYIDAYPDFPSEELLAERDACLEKKNNYQGTLALLESNQARYQNLCEKNSYVTYGKYAELVSYYGYTEYIKFLDKSGRELILKYSDDRWIPMDEISAAQLTIYGLDTSGNLTGGMDAPGGYLVLYSDGNKIYYSKYGVISREVDRNGNQVIYENSNGRVSKITLKTGEVLSVARNSSSLITAITGSVSGTLTMSYVGQYLKSLVQNNGKKVSYEYDEEGSLTKIIKADNTYVSIQYDIANSKKVVSSVRDENGNTETFSLDASNSQMIHKTPQGFNEIYKFNSLGNTIYKKDCRGNVFELENYDNGLIKSVKENGFVKTYAYDSKFRPSAMYDSSGLMESYEYNDYGQISKITDADGFSHKYIYDSKGNVTASYFCGNLCGTYWYYSNGLLKGYSENGISAELLYNRYGSVTRLTQSDQSGVRRVWTWEYDSKNRPVSYVEASGEETTITYGANFQSVKSGGQREVTTYFDARGRVCKVAERDLKGGVAYEKKVCFDGRGRVTGVRFGEEEFASYQYNRDGALKSYTIWNLPDSSVSCQGIKTSFEYDSAGRVISETRSCVSEENNEKRNCISGDDVLIRRLSYSGSGDKLTVYEIKDGIKPYVYVYDYKGRLVKKTNPDEFYIQYTYSRAGRLKTVSDSNLNVYSYDYKSDGRLIVTYKNQKGACETYEYSPCGLLLSKKDLSGFKKYYKYNSEGLLIKETSDSCYYEYSYDSKNRPTVTYLKNSKGLVEYNYSMQYDDENNIRHYMVGNNILSSEKYDAWNRIIEKNDGNGHYWYSYDVLGNRVKVRDADGLEIGYRYAPFGRVAEIDMGDSVKIEFLYDAAGKLLEKKKNGRLQESKTYYPSGLLKSSTNQYGGSISYDYDAKGLITNVNSYDTGSVAIGLENQQIRKKYTSSDGNEVASIFSVGINGNIIREENPYGKFCEYLYDSAGLLVKKINNSGREDLYQYEDYNHTSVIKYGNGEKVKISRNNMGNIVFLENENAAIDFTYDSMGNLTFQHEKKSDTYVAYSYDSLGRCIKKTGNSFSYYYQYDDCGRVRKLGEERSGVWVSFDYDIYSREVKRTFSNGGCTEYQYNDYGDLASLVSKDRLGQIIDAQFLLYDSFGRISALCNKSGLVTKYAYDESSRLIAAIYPYTPEWKDFYKSEAELCGLNIKNEPSHTIMTLLSSEELSELRSLIKNGGYNNALMVTDRQNVWAEYYTYNNTGSVSSVTNPLCTIFYEYDLMNRIKRKYADNTVSGGISFVWNDDDCLSEISSPSKKISFTYGAMNRPLRVEESNLETGELSVTEYAYDALGRRCLVSKNDESRLFIYDGLSSSLLKSELLLKNGAVSSNYFSYNNYLDAGEYKTRLSNYSSSGEQSYSLLSIGGCELAYLYSDALSSSGLSCHFVFSDYRNKVHCVLDANSTLMENLDYDTWGNNLAAADQSLSFTQDFGARDYSPSLKSFTTKEPLSLGMNLFAYCSCDPVNYYDYCGFSKTKLTEAQTAYYSSAIFGFNKFNQTDFIQNGSSVGLQKMYDCADTSTCIDCIASRESNTGFTSDTTKDFSSLYDKGQYAESKAIPKAEKVFTEKGATQVASGYDRDGLRDTSKKNEAWYATELQNKAAAEQALTDPNIITPGSVLAWKNSEHPTARSPTSCDHVLTVLSRDFTESGEVMGFIYIQGHLKESTPTELGYMSVQKGVAGDRVDEFYGYFAGVYEMENSGSKAAAATATATATTGATSGGCGL